MIGLSVSGCIRQIAEGLVKLADVEKIIAGTCALSPSSWEYIIDDYRRYYWRENPDKCEEIFRQLLAEGKIYQPRAERKPAPHLAGRNGIVIWVSSESEINYGI